MENRKCVKCNKIKTIDSFRKEKYPCGNGIRIRRECKECEKKIANIQTNTPKRRYQFYRYSAKRRNFEFKLTIEEFKKFWQKPCYYCGDEIKTIGLDRIDSNKGYLLNNIVPCCWKCNKFKGNRKDFIKHIKKIYKNLFS